MYETAAPLVARREIADGMWVLSYEAPDVARETRAGQFINVGIPCGPLLRRPFSVYRVEGELIEIVLRVVGVGTALLVDMPVGEMVSCLGPLGRPFEIDPAGAPVVLLSGGLGVAPMILAAREAKAAGLRVTWVHGARTAALLSPEWEGDEVVWATDDGSRGERGTVLDAVPGGDRQLLACGPNSMLAAVAARWPEAQVALETYMGCGTGVCLGCAVPLATGSYGRACTEGPVYRAAAVDWAALPGHLAYVT